MNGKLFVTAVVGVAVLVGGGYVLLRGGQDVQPQVSPSPTVSPTPSGTVQGSVKTFTVIGDSFSFDKKEIKVNKGDTVRIVFTNTEGLHDWVVDEFSARTPRIQAGQTSTIEFVADKTGTFQYYCSVGSHRANGMWGNLVVQ